MIIDSIVELDVAHIHGIQVAAKELNQNLLEDYTKAINERPRRIHGYQSAKNLFELIQTD